MDLLLCLLRERRRRVLSRTILRASNRGTSWCCTWLGVPSFFLFSLIRCAWRREVAGRVSRAALRNVSQSRDKGAAPLGRHLDADQRALQRNGGAVPVDIWIVRRQALLGASQRVFGALQVDLFRALGRFRENGDAVRKNLGKSANDGDVRGFLAAHVVIAEFADSQLGHERRVPGQYAQIAVLAGHLYLDGLLAEQLLLRRDDHQL